MGKPIHRNRIKPWVRRNDFLDAVRRWVECQNRFGVVLQFIVNQWNTRKIFPNDGIRRLGIFGAAAFEDGQEFPQLEFQLTNFEFTHRFAATDREKDVDEAVNPFLRFAFVGYRAELLAVLFVYFFDQILRGQFWT